MIPFIRSITELMAITESREIKKDDHDVHLFDSKRRKRYVRPLNNKEINLPDIPKTIKRKWINNKKSISKFIKDLDYNNQIQPSYELTLIDRQYQNHEKDVA